MSDADPDEFHDRLDAIAADVEDASTEADLDDVEAALEAVEADLDDASFPEPEPPDEDDEEEEELPDPAAELADRVDSIRDDIEDQRGPYDTDILDAIETGESAIESTEWATEGLDELVPTVAALGTAVSEALDIEAGSEPDADVESLAESVSTAKSAVADAGLHADEDSDTIATLLDAATTFADGVEGATAFGDLPVREQLNRRGFFDILGHYKDFPPEWSAIKAHEEAGNADMILLAYDLLDSNFLEEHCLDALRRLGPDEALEPMQSLAQRRDTDAISILGKIGSEEPVDVLVDYIDTDSDPRLQKVSLRALGEIGSREATEPVAQQLLAENPEVRSGAARSLGMIGDTRAIAPLTDVLAEDEEEFVRGSAAWALVQIGTSDALSALEPYTSDDSYLVETQARKVTAPEPA